MEILYIILILGIIGGFYQAWNIGANDVANAMGTSVGSGAITLKQAVLIAAIFEFGGAVLVGGNVTNTIRKGILDVHAFETMPEVLAVGMLAALLSAATWLLIATIFGLPVSTTHSIVGGIVGVGVAALGFDSVNWPKLIQIAASWLVSPVMGAFAAFFIFRLITLAIFNQEEPLKAFKKVSPILIFAVFSTITLAIVYKGLKNLHLNLQLGEALLIAGGVGVLCAFLGGFFIKNVKSPSPAQLIEASDYPVDTQTTKLEQQPKINTAELHKGTHLLRAEFTVVENIFKYLQVLTACCIAFAHGSNDVANAIGPLAVIVNIYETQTVTPTSVVPLWVLILGGVGIVIGLATYGYKVINTIGKNITELTPSRGFAAEFAAAATILAGSKLGLPISTTHTLVGSVIGIGLAQGAGGMNRNVVMKIVNSWIITVPFAAILAAVVFVCLRFFLGI